MRLKEEFLIRAKEYMFGRIKQLKKIKRDLRKLKEEDAERYCGKWNQPNIFFQQYKCFENSFEKKIKELQ